MDWICFSMRAHSLEESKPKSYSICLEIQDRHSVKWRYVLFIYVWIYKTKNFCLKMYEIDAQTTHLWCICKNIYRCVQSGATYTFHSTGTYIWLCGATQKKHWSVQHSTNIHTWGGNSQPTTALFKQHFKILLESEWISK